MDHVREFHFFVVDLMTWQDVKNTCIYLFLSTLAILHYEIAIPCACLALVGWLFSNKYYHIKFKSQKADI